MFPSGIIQLETQETSTIPGKPGPGADDPDLWPSPTWRLQFDAYRSGASPAPPYHHERITDAAKLATATAAYQDFLAGHIAKDALTDISDVMPSDQRRLSEMALAVEPDAAGGALLIQACAPCHNAALDQTLSRARFDADLSRVAGAELQEAASRLELSADDPRAMPPREGVRMSADQRKALVAYLRSTDPTKVKPWPVFEAPPTAYHLEQAANIQFSNIDSAASELSTADLTNDGRLDIVGPPYLLVQRDDGTFADPAPLPASPLAYYVRALHVDADGRADLVSTPTRQPSDGTQAGLLTFLSSGAGVRTTAARDFSILGRATHCRGR